MNYEEASVLFWEALLEYQRGQAEVNELQQPDYDEMEAEYESGFPSDEALEADLYRDHPINETEPERVWYIEEYLVEPDEELPF